MVTDHYTINTDPESVPISQGNEAGSKTNDKGKLSQKNPEVGGGSKRGGDSLKQRKQGPSGLSHGKGESRLVPRLPFSSGA
jgi:hypothetical protein